MHKFADCRVLAVAAEIQDFQIEGFLAWEMPVEQGFGNAGGMGEVFGGGFGVAFARKKRERGLNDGRFPFFR